MRNGLMTEVVWCKTPVISNIRSLEIQILFQGIIYINKMTIRSVILNKTPKPRQILRVNWLGFI